MGYAGPAGAYLERDKEKINTTGLKPPPSGPRLRSRSRTVDQRGKLEEAELLPITFDPLGYLQTPHRRMLRGDMHI